MLRIGAFLLVFAPLGLAASLAAPLGASFGAQAGGFDQAFVEARARALAQAPYVAPDERLPPSIDALGYDSWRRIAHARARSIPLGRSGFHLQTYHRGWIFRPAVEIHLVRDGQARPLAFAPDLFDYGGAPPADVTADLGFAGLRLLYPLNRRDKLDEAISFLGASYFRFLGRGQAYGLSARGLALAAGEPGAREEFPIFRAFWIEESDEPGAPAVIHALLDSPSVAGAYRFALHAGARSFVDVAAVLYPRKRLDGLGLAPLTSMFMTGAHDRRIVDPFRMSVHDSDTLLINGRDGAWIARALRNPARAQISEFAGMRAFGLLQRARAFEAFQDLEAHYHLRPSYWVTPRGDWGAGAVRLLELPAPDETGDNVVAFWAPAAPAGPDAPLRFSYSIETLDGGERLHDLARVRIAHMTIARSLHGATHRLIVDFAGGDLSYFSADAQGVLAQASASGARIAAARVGPHPRIGGLRAIVDVEMEEAAARADVSILLRGPDGRALSETFLFPLAREPAEVTAATPAR